MAPHREDFAAWLNDPVTRWVMRAHLAAAETMQATWMAQSWETGMAHQPLLNELRTRADTHRSIAEASYEGLCEQLGDQPRDE